MGVREDGEPRREDGEPRREVLPPPVRGVRDSIADVPAHRARILRAVVGPAVLPPPSANQAAPTEEDPSQKVGAVVWPVFLVV